MAPNWPHLVPNVGTFGRTGHWRFYRKPAIKKGLQFAAPRMTTPDMTCRSLLLAKSVSEDDIRPDELDVLSLMQSILIQLCTFLCSIIVFWMDMFYGPPGLSYLFPIGLPPSYAMDDSLVSLLSGDNARSLNREQTLALLAKGVFMDATALSFLNSIGYEDLTGFAVTDKYEAGCIERFTDHPLNGIFAGRIRDGIQSPGTQLAFALRRTDEKAQSLAGLIDCSDKEIAPCTLGVFENRLGGRVCGAGYYPWTLVHSFSKSSQVKTIMRWLSRDTMPAYVSSFHRINLWFRDHTNGRTALASTNSSLDPASDVKLMIRTDKSQITVFDMACRASVVSASEPEGPYRAFVIPRFNPWEMRLVIPQP